MSTVSITDPTVAETYRLFIDYLDAQRVAYCFIGPSDRFPEDVGGDIDIVVEPETVPRGLHDLVRRFAASLKLQVVQHVWHGTEAHSFVLASASSSERRGFSKLDISTAWVFRGRRLLSAREILHGRRRATDGAGNPRELFVSEPAIQFITYLLSKVEAQTITEQKARHLSQLWLEGPGRARLLTNRFWKPQDAERVARCAESGDWAWVRDNLPRLRRRLHTDPRHLSLRGCRDEARRVWSRFLRPTGVHVVFLGPDGAGKTSVLEATMKSVGPVFARSAGYYLFPTSRLGEKKQPSSQPHALSNWNSSVSAVKVGLWILRYWVGFLGVILPGKVRSSMMLFDRYYDDLLVDPRRYRYGGAPTIARIGRILIPKPDLYILLDASAETIWRRKKEVPLAETERQVRAYRKMASELSTCTTVDASQPLARVMLDVEQAILEHMSRKIEGRFSLGLGGQRS